MCSTDSPDPPQETKAPAPAVSPGEAAQVASDCLAEVGSSLAETAERLREAIEAGTVPPKAAARMISRLEEAAVKASEVPMSPQG